LAIDGGLIPQYLVYAYLIEGEVAAEFLPFISKKPGIPN
jgi:hypothetical protein